MKKTATAAAGIGLILVLAGCASSAAPPTPTPSGPLSFSDALKDCNTGPSSILHVQDSGDSLSIDGKGAEQLAGVGVEKTKCILDALGMPDSTWSIMEQTRALDGRQSESWDGIEASWSYHPDSGLDIVLSR